MSDWQRIWNDDRSCTLLSPVKAILYTLSLFYSLIIKSRNWLYDHHIFRDERLSCPVISVGNITVGGTGKTPCVIMLAQLLKESGLKPAVLSRGYGGKSKELINIISDGRGILLSNELAGDEPVLIARALNGIPVLTGPKRKLTGQTAIDNFGVDVLVCDDAFQHRQIFRDINIVLLDSKRPWGNGYILPRGNLREPWTELRRANAIILTRANESTEPDNCIERDQHLKGIQLFRSRHKAKDIIPGDYTNPLTISSLKGKRVCAFAGIAQPQSFREMLLEAEAKIVSFDIFSDHHNYTGSELEKIKNNFLASNADFLITTEKDGMRLAEFKDILEIIYFLRIELEILPDKRLLKDFILQKLASARQ
jgi:tetraacyldisaccharide 4'-kinase